MKKSIVMCCVMLLAGLFQGVSAKADEITITYTPQSTTNPDTVLNPNNAGGKWQLILVDPDGRLHRDTQNGLIDFQNPPAGPLTFKVKEKIKKGGHYSLVIYSCKRNDSLPVNLALIAGNVLVEFGNANPLISLDMPSFTGGFFSTKARETSQVTINACQRDFVK